MFKLLLVVNTIRYLRPVQIRYQIWYRIRRNFRKAIGFKYPLSVEKKAESLRFAPWIDKYPSFHHNTFSFLNISKTFSQDINWNESEYGKLWLYNLNYMDYLLQPGMTRETGLKLIDHFIEKLHPDFIGLEPYPIALRGINWIKFFSKYDIQDERYTGSLYAQYRILFDNLEFHLLGNHLLEDGFSLFFAGFFFRDLKLYQKAREILYEQLDEQILQDGAHFELSTMYHQIILDRLLDCINVLQNNTRFDDQKNFLSFLSDKASKMVSWLARMTFANGNIPLMNDASPGIAPSSKQLFEYAARLGFPTPWVASSEFLPLSSSGYRRHNEARYECILDIGPIGPAYQPGHAHVDTFNFVLNINNKPCIIDAGISTYEPGKTRLKERGTASHNTVTILDKNSSEVWSSFRVARRAKVTILKDEDTHIIARHDGYQPWGAVHERSWTFSDEKIEIIDTLTGKVTEGKAHLWLPPGLNPVTIGQTIQIDSVRISFTKAKSIEIIEKEIPNGFNRYTITKMIEIAFYRELTTIIEME